MTEFCGVLERRVVNRVAEESHVGETRVSAPSLVPPRPCLDQAIPPNWMSKQEETDQ